MSIDLVELPRIKVSPECHALLAAQAEISGEEINAVVRDWLHGRCSDEIRRITVANQHLKARGLPCIGGVK